MADTDDMVDVAQRELQKLVRQDAGSVCKPEKRVVREDGAQAHCPSMKDAFVAQTTEAGMAVHNLYLLSYDDIPEDWEEGEDGREGGFSVYHEERDVVDLETIRKVSDAGAALVRVGDNNDFVTAVDELLFEHLLAVSR